MVGGGYARSNALQSLKQMVHGMTPSQRLGYLFIFMVASIWVLASFLVQVRLCGFDYVHGRIPRASSRRQRAPSLSIQPRASRVLVQHPASHRMVDPVGPDGRSSKGRTVSVEPRRAVCHSV